jgi:hypothetical protein
MDGLIIHFAGTEISTAQPIEEKQRHLKKCSLPERVFCLEKPIRLDALEGRCQKDLLDLCCLRCFFSRSTPLCFG